jgi:hypothetical protein
MIERKAKCSQKVAERTGSGESLTRWPEIMEMTSAIQHEEFIYVVGKIL